MCGENISIESVSDFLDKTKAFCHGGWIYRGVSNQEYELLPSIGRVRHTTKNNPIAIEEEKKSLTRFIDRVQPYISLSIRNELEWMIVAQHHGVPTRLLDWTLSPLVAAYFSATRIEKMRIEGKNDLPIHGRIYAVKKPQEVTPEDRLAPFDISEVKFIDPPHVSERVPRQSSIFTIHNAPLNAWKPENNKIFTVPMESKFKIKKELDRCGINEASLFPGIDATAGYIKWQLKWDMLS